MKDFIKYIALILLFTGLFSCEKLFEPIDENRQTPDFVESDPESAEGILLHAYTGLIPHTDFTDIATDDAVSNNFNNDYKRMATGQLSAQFNPVQRWNKYTQIFYINKFIEIVESDKVVWNKNDTINLLFKERLLGEALAMRAIYHFYILQAHAGIGASGQLLGIPYYEEYLTDEDDFNLPRLSFEATLDKINADLNNAIDLLPMVYSDKQSDILPKHQGYEIGKYIIANGSQYDLRVSGKIARAIKARIELFAASPAYLNGAGHYEKAASSAAELINMIGGITGLESSGWIFYKSDGYMKSDETIWRSSLYEDENSSWMEEQNFPPSINGSGDLNPSHNLVNAFPMANGYPATVENGYDPQNPFENRDPRLKTYIVLNGDSLYEGAYIYTGVGGGIDRIDSIAERSTRTGYYLKKLIRDDVRINNDGSIVTKKHVNVYLRYTELFLILAEAANEIGGPDHAVEGITARDAIGALRQRAGITPDDYLSTIVSKEDMRTLIQNERRLELCFEGHRFWDIRRWELPLNENVSGYFYDGSQYVELPVIETRDYSEYAKYMPIPNSEIIKFSSLEQNQGW